MTNKDLKILTTQDIRQIMPMEEAINIMRSAFIQISKGESIVPERIHLDITENNGSALVMPSFSPLEKKIGLKLITLYNDNPTRGLPVIHALMLLFDGKTGQPLVLMDGSLLTALRTGAGSGLATELLADKNAKIAAIFGAGEQGKTQLEAINCVRNLEHVYVYDPNAKQAQKFTKEMQGKLAINIEATQKETKLLEADIICTATNSLNPVFNDANISKGTHINAIGSYKPQVREIPSETVVRAKIIVDHKESCLFEAGDIIIPMKEGVITKDHIIVELGEILLTNKKIRTKPDDITLYKSVGNAIQDLVLANHIFLKANKMDFGLDLTF